ncbi:ENHANCER OF YELLOW 2 TRANSCRIPTION FACTOR [Salix purpurea]|uniref:Transcription and mRNA export factor ENY2 n=1 Tax=Salix purpurea TaxID=77065 RepID=A0A9Q0VVW2_SALPP|nr:ENHANCER OF YELLOW 2 TRANSCRIPTION FACTOR [Salix purpurea]
MAWKRCALAGPSSCQNDILCTRFSGFVWAKFDKAKEQSAFRLFDFFIISSRSMRDSVNRPPTPDDTAEEEEKQPTLQETINIKLIESGEKERLMELLRERLIECGWKDEMKALCRIIRCNGRSCSLRYDGADAECVLQGNALDRDAVSFWRRDYERYAFFSCRRLAFIKKKGRNNVTVDDLVHVITPKGRVSIPDSVKAELLQRIRSFLVQAAV